MNTTTKLHPMTIISISLGQTRRFELRKIDGNGKIHKLGLAHGDICTMEGITQKYYHHRAGKGSSTQPRINLTLRWITNHGATCKCRATSEAPVGKSTDVVSVGQENKYHKRKSKKEKNI